LPTHSDVSCGDSVVVWTTNCLSVSSSSVPLKLSLQHTATLDFVAVVEYSKDKHGSFHTGCRVHMSDCLKFENSGATMPNIKISGHSETLLQK